MLTLTTRSHITCSKKGAIVRVVKVFEFEVQGQFKRWHLQAKLKEKDNNSTQEQMCTTNPQKQSETLENYD